MNVSEAVASRRSIRAFLDKPVDLVLLRDLIDRAGRAPSGGNLQPWQIHVVAGDSMVRLKALMAARIAELPEGEGTDYPIYPPALAEPWRTRRYEVGEAMYAAVGIPRGDKERRREQFAANYAFFGAPVGLFCYIDRGHGPPQWSDCGMFLQTLMLLIREAGMDSCPQEAWAMYPRTIDAFLGASPEAMLFTGMSIGWRDPDAPINCFDVARADFETQVTVHD